MTDEKKRHKEKYSAADSTPAADGAAEGAAAAEGGPGDEAGTLPKKGFNQTFWILNCIEMFERLAYFSLRVMAPIYIMQASMDNPGGLHLTADHKGTIYAWWFIFQSLLPIVTGGIADRYGYKRVLFFSITLNTAGYLVMAFVQTYLGFFTGVIMLATGTAFFKPSLQGSLVHSMRTDQSSTGWGLFYWIVNVGSLISHYIAGPLVNDKSPEGWTRLFIAGAVASSMNILLLFTFKDVPSGASKTDGTLKVLWRTLVNIWDARLITWLLIMSCFWLMMYQLWDLQPNFIEDWVDSSMVASAITGVVPESWAGTLHLTETGEYGQVRVPQQVLISLNALLIVLLVVPVSILVRRMRTLSAMFFGMIMATGGVLLAGWTCVGWFLLLGIAFFSLGEMLTGPKKQEYLGLIAPPDKKAMYLGYVNIPVGIGGAFGSKIAGWVYGTYGEKATLALKYLMDKTEYGAGRAWDGSVDTLEKAAGIPRTEAFTRLMEVVGLDGQAATRLLWDTYHPNLVWVPFAAIGVVAAIALAIFGQMAKRWKDMNA